MSISILLDGRDIREFGMYVLEDHEHPLLPDTRDKFITIPDVHGVRDMGSTLGPRYFYIPIGTIPQKDYEKIRRLTENFISLFIDQYGKPKYVKLTFSYYPERYYKVRYAGQLPLQQLVNMGVFTLPLIATDPFAYAPADYYDPDFVPSYDTSTEYDSGVEYKNQTSTPFNNIRQYAGIFNYSHYATPFSFVIEGYVKNPKITNLTSGKSAQLNITVEADERLYFDSKLMTTWKVKASEDKYFWLTPYQIMKHEAEWAKINKYNDMSGDFLELVSGKNSILFEGENPNAYVNFHWEHRFL